jgi:hypothetical protein
LLIISSFPSQLRQRLNSSPRRSAELFDPFINPWHPGNRRARQRASTRIEAQANAAQIDGPVSAQLPTKEEKRSAIPAFLPGKFQPTSFVWRI